MQEMSAVMAGSLISRGKPLTAFMCIPSKRSTMGFIYPELSMQWLTCAPVPELLVTLTTRVSGTPWTVLPDLAVSVVSRDLPGVKAAKL